MANTRCRVLFLRWIPVAAYAALLFYLSSLSQASISWLHLPDKLSHTLIYVGFGFVLLRGFNPFRRHWGWGRMIGIAALGSFLYGVFDEFHQHFNLSRHADWKDVVFDTLGGTVGGILYLILKRHVERIRSSRKVSQDDPSLAAD